MLREHEMFLTLGVQSNILVACAARVTPGGNCVIPVGNAVLLIFGGHHKIFIRHVDITKSSLDTWAL